MKNLKKVLCSIVFVCAIVFLAQPAHAAAVQGTKVNSTIYVNDGYATMNGYNIGGRTYFRIRDLAYALNGTAGQFEVTWNQAAKQIEVLPGKPYTGEQPANLWESRVQAAESRAKLLINGVEVAAKAYQIKGNNYYQLRDLSSYLPYEVGWKEDTREICLYALPKDSARYVEGAGYRSRERTAEEGRRRWSHLLHSNLVDNGDGTLTVVDAEEKDFCTVSVYNGTSFDRLSSREVPMELPLYGGFYAGKNYNFFVFGQENKEEKNDKEVIRVVKYSKNFDRLDSVSISGEDCYTIVPFDAGSLRMAENGSDLVIHTSRKRYTTDDGLNHQSQLTIFINEESMKVTNELGRFQGNHVSHSFNQFAQSDGDGFALIDHGDAYPRSVVMNQGRDNSFRETNLYAIPGPTGANCTGVTVGGFEVSDSSYLVVINSIDHSKATGYDSFNIQGLSADERNIILLVSDKSNPGNVKQIALTDYVGKNMTASTPWLVKVNDNRFVVLWQEFAGDGSGMKNSGVRYLQVDGKGNALGKVQSVPGAKLSSDCQPVAVGGKIVWYLNVLAGRVFYRIEA